MATENGIENRTGYIERTNNGEIVEMENLSQLYSGLVAYYGLSNDIAARTSLSLTTIRGCFISTNDGT